MQLMPATAEQFNVQDPFDPKQNVEAGAQLLKLLLLLKGNQRIVVNVQDRISGRMGTAKADVRVE